MAQKLKLACCFTLCVAAMALSWYEHGLRVVAAQSQPVDYKRDIEPILASNCYGCHGPKKASAQLRLDVKALALRGGLGGAVITAGASKDSRLVHRILGAGGEQRMPLGKPALKPEQIALIQRWIDEGAVWPESESAIRNPQSAIPKHWAFVPPVRPVLPTVKNSAWVKTPIDRFILARLEKEGLAPSPQAEKATLARRVYLDLLGLPPSPKEMDEFLADASPNAYEKLVEKLLASPHYGERWGRWWLDAARYADSNGFEKDETRSIWPYRDWVINAFNRDLPFDQFTVEQLAGDLLANPTPDQIVATGFLRNSMLNEEGAVDPEQFRIEQIVDRVDAIGKAYLGLTINCAQCHTHKFDPIKHDEYYKFFAFLNGDDEAEVEVHDPEVVAKRANIRKQVAAIEDSLMTADAELPRRQAAWEERALRDAGNWTPLDDTTIFSSFGVKFERREDHSFIARGSAGPNATFTVKARTSLKNITGFRLELLTDRTLPRGGPGRSQDGGLALSEFTVDAAPAAQPETARKVELINATADFSHPDNSIKNAIDGNAQTHWTIDAGPGRRNQNRKGVFTTVTPVGFESGMLLTFRLGHSRMASMIGRFRLSVTTDDAPHADPLPSNVRRIIAIPPAKRSDEQRREAFSFYHTTEEKFAEANRKIDELMKGWPLGPTTLALALRETQRETRVFKRGDWKRPGDLAQPDTPSALHPFPSNAPRNRLGLARWITDRNNPLTARVIVNRVWQQYFGQGLVTSPEDFGARCETPSHPELLDWLAVELMGGRVSTASGSERVFSQTPLNGANPLATARGTDSAAWSLKNIHRLIVNSATYRQASTVTPKLPEVDPSNVLLARAPRLRVEAEIVRDIALSASGLLNLKIGGPSVFPPIPDGVMSLAFGTTPMKWEASAGRDRHRRALYTFWKRSVPYPSMLAFDAPSADFSCTRRMRSNTPLQALTTLNDAVFVEAAQAMALRIWREGGADDQSRMNYAYRLCAGRPPDDFELQRLLAFLNKQKARFAGRTASAVYVSAADLNKLPEDVDLHQLAPWTLVARALLNLDETITKE